MSGQCKTYSTDGGHQTLRPSRLDSRAAYWWKTQHFHNVYKIVLWYITLHFSVFQCLTNTVGGIIHHSSDPVCVLSFCEFSNHLHFWKYSSIGHTEKYSVGVISPHPPTLPCPRPAMLSRPHISLLQSDSMNLILCYWRPLPQSMVIPADHFCTLLWSASE